MIPFDRQFHYRQSIFTLKRLLVKKKERNKDWKKERKEETERKMRKEWRIKAEELIFVVREEESRIGDIFHGVAWSFELEPPPPGTGFFYARRAAAERDSRWKFSKQWRVSRDEPGTDIHTRSQGRA